MNVVVVAAAAAAASWHGAAIVVVDIRAVVTGIGNVPVKKGLPFAGVAITPWMFYLKKVRNVQYH